MTHRQPLLALLERYSPTPEECPLKERMVSFIQNNTDCFARSLKSGHITASSWLLNKKKDKALLLLHSKLGIWVQPGGHADGNPAVLEVALKEAKEESGILEIHPLSLEIFDLDIHLAGDHFHYDIRFLLQVMNDQQPILNHESKDFIWVSKNGPLPTKERSILRMKEKWSLH